MGGRRLSTDDVLEEEDTRAIGEDDVEPSRVGDVPEEEVSGLEVVDEIVVLVEDPMAEVVDVSE